MSLNYQFIAKPWSVFKLQPNSIKWEYVSRHRNFSHASGIAKLLQSQTGTEHKVVWNVPQFQQLTNDSKPEKVPVK